MTRFYGVDAFAIPPGRLRVLAGEMPCLKAEEEMEGGVDDDRIYEVVLAATGSKRTAADALTARLASRMRKGEQAGN